VIPVIMMIPSSYGADHVLRIMIGDETAAMKTAAMKP
jgi:hypothetical protein